MSAKDKHYSPKEILALQNNALIASLRCKSKLILKERYRKISEFSKAFIEAPVETCCQPDEWGNTAMSYEELVAALQAAALIVQALYINKTDKVSGLKELL